jgi:hypothetical protein
MAPTPSGGKGGFRSKDLLTGGVLSCAEAASVGMTFNTNFLFDYFGMIQFFEGLPFEVWKTHMGTYRTETTVGAFRSIYKKGVSIDKSPSRNRCMSIP